MTVAHQVAAATRAAGPARHVCVACGRPYGRRRAPRNVEHGSTEPLLDAPELIACDQCWQLAGGTARVLDRLASASPRGDGAADGAADGDLRPVLVFDPAIDQLLADADRHDLLHPIDRLLVSSGVRWSVLRHIAVPARTQLASSVMNRPAPPGTCSAESDEAWLDAVDERIIALTGTEFRYRCKARRWRGIAHALSSCADRGRRPLAWVTQDELAAAAGCTTRTVRRCVRWLREQGLLWEIIPGCRMPQANVPDGETDGERGARLARLARAAAAEDAAMARARAELDAIRTTAHPPAGQMSLPLQNPPALAGGPAAGETGDPDWGLEDAALLAALDLTPLVNIAPVYELRVPRPGAQRAEEGQLEQLSTRQLSPGEVLLAEHAAAWVAPVNAHCHRELVTVDHAGHLIRLPTPAALDALTSGNAIGLLRPTENVLPPEVFNKDQKSRTAHAVEKGGAPRRSEHIRADPLLINSEVSPPTGLGVPVPAPQKPASKQSRAVRSAQWLLNAGLHPVLCDGVSVRWLAGLIRGSHLLDRHGWTDEDLADLLHGFPEHAHLPRWVQNPRGWIRARFARATPALPPSDLRVVLEVERRSEWFREQRRLESTARMAAEVAERRAAIAACGLCDELGWLHLAGDTPTSRCSHEEAAGGW